MRPLQGSGLVHQVSHGFQGVRREDLMEGTEWWCLFVCKISLFCMTSMQQRASTEDQETFSMCGWVLCLHNNKPFLQQSRMNFWREEQADINHFNTLYFCILCVAREMEKRNMHYISLFLVVPHVSSYLMINISFSHNKLNIIYFQKLLRGHQATMHLHIASFQLA